MSVIYKFFKWLYLRPVWFAVKVGFAVVRVWPPGSNPPALVRRGMDGLRAFSLWWFNDPELRKEVEEAEAAQAKHDRIETQTKE